MRIGLDMDGVIADSIPQWIHVMNTKFGTKYAPGELPDTYGTPEAAAFCDDHLIELLIPPKPVAGAADALAQLARDGHERVVITHRTPLVTKLTYAWLEFYGMSVDRIHFLEGASKVGTALAEAVDLMVEDAPANALTLAEAGVKVVLFGAPYNAHVRHPNITRCEGWDEVLSLIAERMERSA